MSVWKSGQRVWICPWKVIEFCLCKVAQTMLSTGLVTIFTRKSSILLLIFTLFGGYSFKNVQNMKHFLIPWKSICKPHLQISCTPNLEAQVLGKKIGTTNFELPIKFYYWTNKDKQLLLPFQNIDTRWLLQAFVSIKSLDSKISLLYLYLECLLCLL